MVGLVQNMAYFVCNECNKKHYLFGEHNVEELAKRFAIQATGEIPLSSKLAGACDKGMIELFDGTWLDSVADTIEKLEQKK